MPLVSVIIPCYNQGRFLGEAVQSVTNQFHQNWECIIVNDGSTDNTDEIAHEWVNEDSRIKCLSKNNGGLSSARNEGLRLAKGKYLQFLDADDLIEPEKLSKQLDLLKGKPENSIAICDHLPFDDITKEFAPRMYVSPFIDTQNFKKEIITEWEFRRSIPPHNLLIPNSLVSKHQLLFHEGLPNHEDWVFWSQLFYFAPAIYFQDEKLTKFRMHSASMSNNREKMAQGFLAATFVLETFYKNAGASDFIQYVRKMRKEVKNNLFPYSPLYGYYAEFVKWMKIQLSVQK